MLLAKQKHNHHQGLWHDEERKASWIPSPGGKRPYFTAVVLVIALAILTMLALVPVVVLKDGLRAQNFAKTLLRNVTSTR